MTEEDQEFITRKLIRGLYFKKQAEALTNAKIAKLTGCSESTVKKVTGKNGKANIAYETVMPFIAQRDRYLSYAATLRPEVVAKDMSQPLDVVKDLYEYIIEINFKDHGSEGIV